MSQEAEIVFVLQRRRREELFRARVSNKTWEFYQRYHKQYKDMCSQGYEEYIPEEMGRLAHDLSEISSSLESGDPVMARSVSQEVGSYIRGLWHLGKEARKVFRESSRVARVEAERKAKASQDVAKSAALSRYYDLVGGLDSITANFARTALNEVKTAISAGTIGTAQVVEEKLRSIIANAQSDATRWKEQKRQEQARQAIVEQIEEQQTAVRAEKFEDSGKEKELLAKLTKIKERSFVNQLSMEEAQAQLRSVSQETDEAVVDEKVRREMAIAISKWFAAHDFTVHQPRLIDGAVFIKADKPSGN